MENAYRIATFKNGYKELHISTYLMCVLVLFNDVDQLSFNKFEKAAKINSLVLMKCLYSMVLAKGENITNKEPMKGYISERDALFVNDMFRNKLYKIKLQIVTTKRKYEYENLET